MRVTDYDIEDVLYAQYYSDGYTIHAAYQHNKFGTLIGYSCINLVVSHAK